MSRTTDRAASKLSESTEQVKHWKRREEQLVSELAAAEANVGASALASGDLEGAAASVSKLREQLNTARRTVEAAEAAQRVAQSDAWRAEADDLRTEAAKTERDADKHARKTRDLLDQLRDHEGGTYVPDQPHPGVASDKHHWTPRSVQLANRAANLRRQAEKLERQAANAQQKEQTSTPRDPLAA